MVKNIIKGFIIGIGKIVPGVSGSMLAISLGVYEKALGIIANFRKVTWSQVRFLLYLVVGIFIGIIIFSRGVKWLLSVCYLPTILLFIGLIIGGFPDILRELKGTDNSKGKRIVGLMILTISFTLSYFLTTGFGTEFGSADWNNHDNIFLSFLLGIIEAFSSIVPGISGTAIYMSLGCYDMLLSFFSNMFNPEYFKFAIFFSTGIVVGLVVLAKLITYLLKKHKMVTYYGIVGFMICSVFVMFKTALNNSESFGVFATIGCLMLIWLGYKITIKVNRLFASD